MCLYLYIHNKYTQHTHILYILCKQKLLFWMWLVAINRLTALIYILKRHLRLHCYKLRWHFTRKHTKTSFHTWKLSHICINCISGLSVCHLSSNLRLFLYLQNNFKITKLIPKTNITAISIKSPEIWKISLRKIKYSFGSLCSTHIILNKLNITW